MVSFNCGIKQAKGLLGGFLIEIIEFPTRSLCLLNNAIHSDKRYVRVIIVMSRANKALNYESITDFSFDRSASDKPRYYKNAVKSLSAR